MSTTTESSAVKAARDPRAIILACLGLVVIGVIVFVVINALPGDVPTDVKNTDGESAVAIGSAAFTAIASVISAYFGVKVANVAREDAVKTSEQATQTVAEVARMLQGGGQQQG